MMRVARLVLWSLSIVMGVLVGSLMLRTPKIEMHGGRAGPVMGRELPLIFVGGMPRSGTTLMRAMLDAHPAVRCGQETRVVPRILSLQNEWINSKRERIRLDEAGVTTDVLDNAVAAFILEIVVRHGPPAPRLCNKDPLTISQGMTVVRLFPNSKFIFMVRDGRAVVHSIISRSVSISHFNITDYRQSSIKWNEVTGRMYKQCEQMGPEHCLMVHYEVLVLQPRRTMERILDYLGLKWDDSVVQHTKQLGKKVMLSAMEPSSNQVVRPIYNESLSKWVNHFPKEVLTDIAGLAPMLSTLGYDPYENSPDYNKLVFKYSSP